MNKKSCSYCTICMSMLGSQTLQLQQLYLSGLTGTIACVVSSHACNRQPPVPLLLFLPFAGLINRIHNEKLSGLSEILGQVWKKLAPCHCPCVAASGVWYPGRKSEKGIGQSSELFQTCSLFIWAVLLAGSIQRETRLLWAQWPPFSRWEGLVSWPQQVADWKDKQVFQRSGETRSTVICHNTVRRLDLASRH